MPAAFLLSLALVLPARAASTSAFSLPGLSIAESDPKKAALIQTALDALAESPAARRAAADFAASGATVTVRWAALDSSSLSFSGIRTIVTGQSAFTQYTPTGTVISLNERLIGAAAPRELAQDLAHEALGHAAERARADRAGVGYAYAVDRDNETGAALLGWLVAAELGLPQRDEEPFAYLRAPEDYLSERVFNGVDYAAALTPAQLPRARELYADRAALARRRAAEWKDDEKMAERQLAWIRHFEKDHAWPEEPFALLRAELENRRDEEAPRNVRLLERIAATLDDLRSALDESASDRKSLADARRHPLVKRWAAQVRERAAALKLVLKKTGQESAPLQARPDGELSQAQLLAMIDADLKFHAGAGAPLPDDPK